MKTSRNVTRETNTKYDPEAFIPERFLDASQNTVDPAMYAFGFGRRYAIAILLPTIHGFESIFMPSICPGKSLAENSVFIIIASLLASFDILPPDSADLKADFDLGLVRYACLCYTLVNFEICITYLYHSYPNPFKCRIVPRRDRKEELLKRLETQHTSL